MADGRSESRQRIMAATHEALIETGYADLTMSTIADKSGTSTGLLHYHFDTKEDLLVAFLDHVLDRMRERFSSARSLDAIERLTDFLSLYDLTGAQPDRTSLHVALVELRGQAPHNARYRHRFQQADALLTSELEDIFASGVCANLVRDVDYEKLIPLVIASIDGARTRAITIEDATYPRKVHGALYERVLREVFTERGRQRWEEVIG